MGRKFRREQRRPRGQGNRAKHAPLVVSICRSLFVAENDAGTIHDERYRDRRVQQDFFRIKDHKEKEQACRPRANTEEFPNEAARDDKPQKPTVTPAIAQSANMVGQLDAI